MARTIKHAAVVILVNADDTVAFEITKVLEGTESYKTVTRYGLNCYNAAMDMARDNGSHVCISENAARLMNSWACNIDHEWNIVSSLRDYATPSLIRKALGK